MINSRLRVTERQAFKNCKRAWYFRNKLLMENRITSPNYFWEGIGGHYALAHYYRDKCDPLEKYNSWYNKQLATHAWNDMLLGQAEESHRLISFLLKEYSSWAPEQDKFWEVIAVELPIRVEINFIDFRGHCKVGILEGTPDMLIKINGDIWIVDHKFFKRLINVEEIDYDQMIAYCFLVKENYGVYPKGVIINQLYKKFPATPQKVYVGKANEGLSTAKNIITTRDIFVKAIIENEYNPADYVDILERLETNQFLVRVQTEVSKEAIKQFERQLKNEFIEFFNYLETTGKESECCNGEEALTKCVPNVTKNCKFCFCRDVCEIIQDGGNPELLINTLYKSRETLGYGTEMDDTENG